MEYTVLLKKSGELVDGAPKAPTSLEYGELALNYSDGSETIFLKNTNGEIFSFNFNCVLKLKEEMDKKLKDLNDDVIDDEEVIANAIDKISTASGIIKDDGTIGYDCKNTNYLEKSKSLMDAIRILDFKIKEIETNLGK